MQRRECRIKGRSLTSPKLLGLTISTEYVIYMYIYDEAFSYNEQSGYGAMPIHGGHCQLVKNTTQGPQIIADAQMRTGGFKFSSSLIAGNNTAIQSGNYIATNFRLRPDKPRWTPGPGTPWSVDVGTMEGQVWWDYAGSATEVRIHPAPYGYTASCAGLLGDDEGYSVVEEHLRKILRGSKIGIRVHVIYMEIPR